MLKNIFSSIHQIIFEPEQPSDLDYLKEIGFKLVDNNLAPLNDSKTLPLNWAIKATSDPESFEILDSRGILRGRFFECINDFDQEKSKRQARMLIFKSRFSVVSDCDHWSRRNKYPQTIACSHVVIDTEGNMVKTFPPINFGQKTEDGKKILGVIFEGKFLFSPIEQGEKIIFTASSELQNVQILDRDDFFRPANRYHYQSLENSPWENEYERYRSKVVRAGTHQLASKLAEEFLETLPSNSTQWTEKYDSLTQLASERNTPLFPYGENVIELLVDV